MDKKRYEGLEVKFIDTNGVDIITASPAECSVDTVQYYVTTNLGECDSQDPTDSGEIGYSYNWNRRPTGA